MTREIALDKTEIVSGKPLPFSVFDPTRKLLLAAKGQMVTDKMREALLRNGLMAVMDDADVDAFNERSGSQEARSPLFRLKLHYARASAISRSGFRVSRDERSESYTCRVVGIGERRGLLLTAPAKDDRSYVAISEGQNWLFRTFYATAAIRFTGTIEKVLFDPFPYFHVEIPALVEMRHIRKVQRVGVCLDATLELGAPIEAVIVDLSSTGMRIAVDDGVELQETQSLKIVFRFTLLGQLRELRVHATVVRNQGNADSLHPQTRFYGLGVETQTDFDQLLLHAYVQGCVINELDGLSKMLAG
jgi:c-di-GMP-binding flagellar brake protein YcgR